ARRPVGPRRRAVAGVVVSGPPFGTSLAGETVLVTGAHGLLGTWLTGALLARGARVVIVERDRPARSALRLEGLEAEGDAVHGDVCDLALMTRAVGEYEAGCVFHLAAQTIVGIARRSPLS